MNLQRHVTRKTAAFLVTGGLAVAALGVAGCSSSSDTSADDATDAPTASAVATDTSTPSEAATQAATESPTTTATETTTAAATETPTEAATGTVSANNATIAELTAAFEAAGISNASRWAREVDEYRPYPDDDPDLPKLRGELAKYNPGPGVVDAIVATLSLP